MSVNNAEYAQTMILSEYKRIYSDGYGDGDCYGDGDGDGEGYGDGYGCGEGYGDSDCCGDGYGYYGDGEGNSYDGEIL